MKNPLLILNSENAFNACVPVFIFAALFSPFIHGHIIAEAFLVVFLLLLAVRSRIAAPSLPDGITCYLLASLAMTLYLSLFLNDALIQGDAETGNIYGTVYTYSSILLVFMAGYNLANRDSAGILVVAIVLAGTLISLIGLCQFFNLFGVPAILDRLYSTSTLASNMKRILEFRFRITSVMDSNPHLLGDILLLPMMFLIVGLNSVKSALVKALLALALAVHLACFFLTLAKTATVFFLIWLMIHSWRKSKAVFLSLVFIGAAGYYYLSSGYFLSGEYSFLLRGFQDFFLNPANSTSLHGRYYYWSVILSLMENDFIRLGFGGGQYVAKIIQAREVYNDSGYVYHLTHGGLLGLSVFLMMNLRILYLVFSRRPGPHATLGEVIFFPAFAAYFAIVLGLAFSSGINTNYVKWSFIFWFQLGVFLKMHALDRELAPASAPLPAVAG